jgi:NitT/TauT family transport system ATP-binding protein
MNLDLRGVAKRYPTRRGETSALEPVDLSVRAGEFVSLVGPSGCGKSTLLHIVAGLEPASAGLVVLGGETVRGPGAELGLVFQKQTLFPWLSVWDNVRFPETLRRRRVPGRSESEIRERASYIENLLRLVGLWEFRHGFPAELSGGMQQRAALARALVGRPDVLLMDEPFGALDAETREEMQELLLRVIGQHRTTTLFVTHDVDEALLLSDRVVVLSGRPGRVVEDVAVPFPRDARSSDLKLDGDFLLRRREILALLRQRSPDDGERGTRLERFVNQQHGQTPVNTRQRQGKVDRP